MKNFSEVFIYSDQPVTFPSCGSRTEILLDFSHTIQETQIHKCYSDECNFAFVIQNDTDFNHK